MHGEGAATLILHLKDCYTQEWLLQHATGDDVIPWVTLHSMKLIGNSFYDSDGYSDGDTCTHT